MNYYDILDIPKNATTDQIKQKYRKFAKLYHPDKISGKEEEFKQINEAYHTLMDPIKRHEYDIQLNNLDYSFTQEDYDLIFKYYNSFINSVEVRLMISLYYSLPKRVRHFTDLQSLFRKKSKSTTLTTTTNYKRIDATQLYDNITLHFKRSLDDVFKRICKQILIKTRQGYYYLCITDSDYNICIWNDTDSLLILELTTNSHNKYTKKGYDLYYTKNIDLYEYYYGTKFALRLPNKLNICCIAKELLHKDYSKIESFGFYNPSQKQRGNLIIKYNLIHNTLSDEHIHIMRNLFHKKEIFIDPSYPIFNI